MPGIFIFGRRWMAASDGLVFTFGTSVVLRVAWLILICIIFGIHSEILRTGANSPQSEEECKGKVNIYLAGYITLLAVICVIDCLVCYTSSRGRIFEVHKRQAVVPLLYVRCGLLIIELTWTILGFIWMFSEEVRENCHSMPTKRLAQGVVIFNFLFMIGIFVTVYFAFDSAGRLWPRMESTGNAKGNYGSIDKEIKAHYEKKWEKSLRYLFCCTKLESSVENVFAFVSSLLSDYFQEYLDLVPSDIVTGLILLRRRQKILESRSVIRALSERERDEVVGANSKKTSDRCVHRYQKTGSAKSFNFSNTLETQILEDVMHFSPYALAIYGWPFYLYDRIMCGACTLCCKIRCCASCCRPTKNDFILVEDNCCECNIEATKQFLKDREHDIVFVSYKDEVYQPPFFVAVDHKKKAVIVSCRGTLSLKDVLTDVMIEEEKIPVEGGKPNWMGHKGMIQSAMYVMDLLEKEGLLEKAFNSSSERNTQSYKLTIVGHSLGAGVASILAFLLRPKYPDLICYAYSAVGATFNYDASKHARDFIYSIVVGKDVIARLNLHTLDELRYMVIQLLHRTNLPKWKIMRGCLCQCMLCCQATTRKSHEDYSDYEFHDIPDYEPESPKRYYMGGKVIHIVKTQSIYPKYCGQKKAVYEAVWADVEDFQSILISNLMWKDHVPDTVKQALESCVSQLHLNKETCPTKEKSNGHSHKDEKSFTAEEKVHLLAGEDEKEAPVLVKIQERSEETMNEVDSTIVDEVFIDDVKQTAEVHVEIYHHKDGEEQAADASAEETKNKVGIDVERPGEAESETKFEAQEASIKEKSISKDSFEIVVSTENVECTTEKETEATEVFEVIDVVVKADDVPNAEVKIEDKVVQVAEDKALNETKAEDSANLGVSDIPQSESDAVKDVSADQTEGDDSEFSDDAHGASEVEVVNVESAKEDESANISQLKEEVIVAPDAKPFDEVKDEAKTGDNFQAAEQTDLSTELTVEASELIVSVGQLKEESKDAENCEDGIVTEAMEDAKRHCTQEEVAIEITEAVQTENDTVVTIETENADESDFVILESETCAELSISEASSKEQVECSSIEVNVVTDGKANTADQVA